MTRFRYLLVALSILTFGAACSEFRPADPQPTPTGHTTAEYAECRRGQGLTMEQYTDEKGTTQSRPDKQRNATAKINAATEACRTLLPSDGDSAGAGPAAADIEAKRQYASCIRDHGVAEFPDPDPRTGDYVMADDLGRRIKENPNLNPAMEACRGVLPASTSGGVVGG